MFSPRNINLNTLYWLSFGFPLILGIVVAPTMLETTHETPLFFVQTIAIAVSSLYVPALLLVLFAHEPPQE